MNNLAENQIQQYIAGRNIKDRLLLSESFGIKCEKFLIEDNETFIAKYYIKKRASFNSIVSEANSIKYLLNKFSYLFPSIKYKSKNVLITEYINHNNIKNKNYQKILAKEISKIHKVTNDKCGFKFDAQIGGLKQSNTFEKDWTKFFAEKRLNMIFEKINNEDPLPKVLNTKIEKLLKNLKNYLPNNVVFSLLHGDLWEGNILFHNGKLVGLIDPGIYFGHNELEIAYLTWFKLVDSKFIDYYSNIIKVDKYFNEYEPVYQLYYSLLNVYLWNRSIYIKDVGNLLKKII